MDNGGDELRGISVDHVESVSKGREKAGFTLVELLVVVLIVAILAAVAVPIFRGKINEAKWSEGKAMMGTVATALRAYAVEKGAGGNWPGPSALDLGFSLGDLSGTYFTLTAANWAGANFNESASPELTFEIVVDAQNGITSPSQVRLDQGGNWTVTP